MTFRSYADLTDRDVSDLAGQVGAQRLRVRERLAGVKQVVAVMSGKGGVGKSHVTALLASGLAPDFPNRLGVLDADLRSPTVAKVLDARGPLRITEGGIEPALAPGGIRVVSTHLLLAEGQPLAWREPGADQFIWRGALEANALREFLADVIWGELDLLLVDLPPGADGVADLGSLVPTLTGAVVVTIPSEESERSVQRAGRAALDAGIPLLGVVENMSGYRCPGCDEVHPLFAGTGGTNLSDSLGVPLLAEIPLTPGAPAFEAARREHRSLLARFLEVVA